MKLALSFLAAATICGTATAATTVSLPRFDSVELRGGGRVILTHGFAQSVRLVQGSTAFTRFHVDSDEPHKLVIDACNADCPLRYDLEIEIVTPDIAAVAISGGGKIEAAGAFPGQHSVAAAVHGGGTIDLRALDAADAKAAVDGGGEIRLKPRHALTAAINGGGKILYWGKPSITQAVNGGGRVARGG